MTTLQLSGEWEFNAREMHFGVPTSHSTYLAHIRHDDDGVLYLARFDGSPVCKYGTSIFAVWSKIFLDTAASAGVDITDGDALYSYITYTLQGYIPLC